MRIESVTLQGFRSISTAVTFDFAQGRAGFYFMTGENRVEPQLSPNGAGKSTLLVEGPYWILYGTTTEGLRAGQVSNWGSDQRTLGRLDFTHAGHHWRLFRQWGPNKLRLQRDEESWRTVKQEEINALIGMSPLCLRTALLVPQRTEQFLSLQRSEQLQLISTLLDLDYWERCAKTAGAQAKEVQSTISTTRENLQHVEGSLQSAKEQLRKLKSLQQTWEQDHVAARSKLESNIAECEQELEQAANTVERHKAEAEAANNQADTLTPQIRALEKKVQKRENKIKDLERDIRALDEKITSSEDQLGSLAMTRGTLCPTCLQDVPEHHADRCVETYNSRIADYQSQKEELESRITKLKTKVEEGNKKLNRLRREEGNNASALERKRRLLRQAENEQVRLQTKLDGWRQQLHDHDNEANPYTAQRTTQNERIKEYKAQRTQYKKALKAATEQLHGLEYWAKGFKELRLFATQKALTQLEIEMNNALSDLGLVDWAIKLDIERENKSGTLSRGLTVLVQAPHSQHTDEWVPLKAWSGGEAQRLALAGTLGLNALIQAQTGVYPNLEVWDEPTTHLNANGITDLLTLLQARATRHNKQVWLIDQHTHDAGHFDAVYRVVKAAEQSYVQQT